MAKVFKKRPPRQTIHRFLLTVAAPAKTSAEDVQAAVDFLIDAGLTDLHEGLRLPDEEQWGTEVAAELGEIKLKPLQETP